MAIITSIDWTNDYTDWGTGTDNMVGHPEAISDCFSNLIDALNGKLSSSNFQELLHNYYSGSDKTWSNEAIHESKIAFDTDGGHDHANMERSTWGDHKIGRKNLDARSVRAVWTALEGLPAEELPHGLTCVGGVAEMTHTISVHFTTLGTFTVDTAIPDEIPTWSVFLEPLATSNWNTATNFIKWTDASYWRTDASSFYTTDGATTYGTFSDYSPFKPYAPPIVLANVCIPQIQGIDTTNTTLAPQFNRYGNFVVLQQPVNAAHDGYNFGFFMMLRNWRFCIDAEAHATSQTVVFKVPWLAIGPGGSGWVA